MKVTFVLWNLKLTGGVRVILKVANGLTERGHDVTVMTLNGESPFSIKSMVQVKREIAVPWKPLHLVNVLKLARGIPASDITVATFCPTAYSICLGGKGVLFYYIQHYEPLLFANMLLQYIAETTYRLPLNWIVNSTWLRNILRRKFNKDGFLVHPGIDLDIFYAKEAKRSENEKRIVCLGKSALWKGLQDAINAMRIVYEKRKNVKLLLYGSEPWIKLRVPIPCEYINKPTDEELANLYSSASVVINPSWYESFPLPPLEAMACGSPVVTTRYGTEDYAFHEENALVVSPRKPIEMAKAILRILSEDSLAEKLRQRGVETASQFKFEKTVNRIEKLFKNALART